MSILRILKRGAVDDRKWNALIDSAACQLPYAFTWYLDAVAENWSALVHEDYQAVMPLVWLRKLGVKCIYQPYYCQQLGVFSMKQPKTEIFSDFTNYTRQNFAYIDINFNPLAAPAAETFSMRAKKNLLLNLNKTYPEIHKDYASNIKRNIARAGKAGLRFLEETELGVFQKFYLGNVSSEKDYFRPRHIKIFKSISEALIANKAGKIFAAADGDGNLMACVLLIFHHNRIIAIINTSSESGKKHGAAHFLFDRLIQKFSGQPYLLDFEGSSIPGVASFYEGFGAQPEIFYNYHYNIVKNAAQWFK